MKKLICGCLLAVLAAGSAGCASVQKKFTRKAKKPAYTAQAVYLEEGPYQKKFSNEYYYKTHYTFWKGWHDQLLDDLGENQKKLRRDAEEAMSSLKDMANYLTPEKRAELKPVLDAMLAVVIRIQNNEIRSDNQGPFRTELDRIRRQVENGFYYEKVKDSILTEEVDLLGGGAAAPDTAS